MTRTFLLRSAATLVAISVAATVVQAQTPVLPAAATLVAKYSDAVGGPAFLASKSVVTKGGMSMPAAGINATFELVQLAPNQMSLVTEIPGMGKIEAGYDGTTAWSVDPMQGARVLDGAELAQIRDEADRRGAIRSPEMFTSIETVSDTTMNSERCFMVKLMWKSGRESYDCYSAATGLLVASKSVQKTAMGDIPVVTFFNEYKKFGSVNVATKTTQEAMGQQQVLTVNSVEFGNGTGVSIAPPASVQSLIKPPAK